MHRFPQQRDETHPFVRAILIVAGGLLALGAGLVIIQYLFAMVFVLAKVALVVGVAGAAGYLGYRVLARQGALPSRQTRALPPADDYEARMRELDRIDRALDAKISRR